MTRPRALSRQVAELGQPPRSTTSRLPIYSHLLGYDDLLFDKPLKLLLRGFDFGSERAVAEWEKRWCHSRTGWVKPGAWGILSWDHAFHMWRPGRDSAPTSCWCLHAAGMDSAVAGPVCFAPVTDDKDLIQPMRSTRGTEWRQLKSPAHQPPKLKAHRFCWFKVFCVDLLILENLSYLGFLIESPGLLAGNRSARTQGGPVWLSLRHGERMSVWHLAHCVSFWRLIMIAF